MSRVERQNSFNDPEIPALREAWRAICYQHSPVWRGEAYLIGDDPMPHLEATLDAREHDQIEHVSRNKPKPKPFKRMLRA